MIASLTRSTFPGVLAVLAGPGGLVFNNEPVVLYALTHIRMELPLGTLLLRPISNLRLKTRRVSVTDSPFLRRCHKQTHSVQDSTVA